MLSTKTYKAYTYPMCNCFIPPPKIDHQYQDTRFLALINLFVKAKQPKLI